VLYKLVILTSFFLPADIGARWVFWIDGVVTLAVAPRSRRSFLPLSRNRLDELARYALNVSMSKPGGPTTMPVNIICPSHFVQGGRSIALRLRSSEMSVSGIMLSPGVRRERDTLDHRCVDRSTRIHKRLIRCPILISLQNKCESSNYLKSAHEESSDILAA
jgi:hypothetical protein